MFRLKLTNEKGLVTQYVIDGEDSSSFSQDVRDCFNSEVVGARIVFLDKQGNLVILSRHILLTNHIEISKVKEN